jgi:hypothetical protein
MELLSFEFALRFYLYGTRLLAAAWQRSTYSAAGTHRGKRSEARWRTIVQSILLRTDGVIR